jgi:hypothetical protein
MSPPKRNNNPRHVSCYMENAKRKAGLDDDHSLLLKSEKRNLGEK